MVVKPNFTPKSQEAIRSAKKVAVTFKHPIVELDHLLWALASLKNGALRQILKYSKVDCDCLIESLETSFKAQRADPKVIKYSFEFRSVLELAHGFSMENDHDYVAPEHIFFYLLKLESQLGHRSCHPLQHL